MDYSLLVFIHMMLASMHAAAHHTSHHSAAVQVSWLPGWSMSSWSASGRPGTYGPCCMPWHGMACTRVQPARTQCKEIEKRTQGSAGCVRTCRGRASYWTIEIETTRPWKSLASTCTSHAHTGKANSIIYQAYTIW